MQRTNHLFDCFLLVLLPVLGAEAQEKLPVPPDPAQQESLALVKEIHGEEWDRANTDEHRQVLAKKLLSKALESPDPTNRFVLLRVARDVASQGGDGLTAFRSIDEMARMFQIDPVTMKASVIYSLSKKARLPAEHKSVAEQSLLLLEAAVAGDDFDTAIPLAKMSLEQARDARDRNLLQRSQDQVAEVQELATEYEQVKTANTTLASDPTNAEANLVVGKYRCFAKGDWDTGLLMLALGSDPQLKALSTRELQEVSRATDQEKLGDAWWELAETATGKSQTQCQRRAAYWYRKAVLGLTGLAKAKVETRLEASKDATPGAIVPHVRNQVYLADLRPEKVVMYASHDGKTLVFPEYSIGGIRYDHCLWAGPPYGRKEKRSAHYLFKLDGSYREFQGVAGIVDGPKQPENPLTFRVVGNGKLLWQSRPIKKRGEVQPFRVSISGVLTLQLYVDCPGSRARAHAVWASPVISK